MSIHKTKNGKWELRWREGVKQRSRTFHTRYQANDFLERLKRKQEALDPEALVSFEEFYRVWHRDYCMIEKTEYMWSRDAYTVEKHLLPTLGTKLLPDLTSKDLTEIKIALKRQGYAPKTANNILGLGKRILEVAVEWNVLKANPFRQVKPLPTIEQPYDYWSGEEIERFLGWAKVYDREIWEISQLALNTGMRLGEILGLKRDRVDFERRQITVCRTYNERMQKLFEFTKTKKWRVLPMNDQAYEVLRDKKLYALDQHFFPRFTKSVCARFKKGARKAKVRPIRFHDLRHTFASHLVMQGTPLYNVSKLLGHSTLEMTSRYAHLDTSDLSRDVRNMFGEGSERKLTNLKSLGKSGAGEGIRKNY